MRKPAFCICENKDADQLRSNCAADQRLCFRYLDSTTPRLPKSEISSLYPSSVAVQPGLCRTRSETPKTGFLTTRLKQCNTWHCWRIWGSNTSSFLAYLPAPAAGSLRWHDGITLRRPRGVTEHRGA